MSNRIAMPRLILENYLPTDTVGELESAKIMPRTWLLWRPKSLEKPMLEHQPCRVEIGSPTVSPLLLILG
jgi:hypothetical protein